MSEFSHFTVLGTEMGSTLKSEAYIKASALWNKLLAKEHRLKAKHMFFKAAEEAYSKIPRKSTC